MVVCVGSCISQFSEDKDGVIRLGPAMRATISQTRLLKNEVATGKPSTLASGPAMCLYTEAGKHSAAAWSYDCEIGGSLAGNRFRGEVAVGKRDCRVYSTTALPSV